MTHLNYSLKKLGRTFKLQKELLKTEMNHDEVDGNIYRDKIKEWLPYVKNDVLCTAFSYARYCKAMEEITGFSMKDCLSVPGLCLEYVISVRTEEYEPIYTYNDKYMRWFVRQAAYVGRVCAFIQYYKSKISDDILKIISKELNLDEKANVYEKIEAYMKYKNDHSKIIKEEYGSKFDDYRNTNEEEMNNFINKKLSELPIHQFLQRLSLIDLMWDCDCVSLYPSAMWDKKSIYPRIETGYAVTKDMIDVLVEMFNNQTFTKGYAILKVKYYDPKNLIVQHLPVNEKIGKLEVNRLRNGYIDQYLTSVDIQEIVKTGGKAIKIY